MVKSMTVIAEERSKDVDGIREVNLKPSAVLLMQNSRSVAGELPQLSRQDRGTGRDDGGHGDCAYGLAACLERKGHRQSSGPAGQEMTKKPWLLGSLSWFRIWARFSAWHYGVQDEGVAIYRQEFDEAL